MYERIPCLGALVCWALTLLTGCKPSDGRALQSREEGKELSSKPIAALHWAGMNRIAKETNGAAFLKIWRLPESERLKTQTLDKLALAPWTVADPKELRGNTNYAALLRGNPLASALRPLLDELIQNEWYLQVGRRSASGPELTLCIKLEPKEAATWDSSLQKLLLSISRSSHLQSKTNGWLIQVTNAADLVPAYLKRAELAHVGPWTVLGLAPETNPVLAETTRRIQHGQTPSAVAPANAWLQADFDARRLSAAFSWGLDLPKGWPEVSMQATGTGGEIHTQGQMAFDEPVQLTTDPWNIPTNLLHEPVQSFTALRGFRPWLSSSAWWRNVDSPSTPNQLFCWSQGGSPFLDYAAAPSPEPGAVVSKLGLALMDTLNPILATNRMGKWERASSSDGVIWKGPIVTPFIQSSRAPQGFVFGGLFPYTLSNGPAPAVTLGELLAQSNTVYFSREITGARLETWMFLSQLGRIVFRRAQLSQNSACVHWLRAIGPFVAPSLTVARQTSPNVVQFERRSSLGVSAAELHFLTDWLESPEFPAKLHSQVAKLPSGPPALPRQVFPPKRKNQ